MPQDYMNEWTKLFDANPWMKDVKLPAMNMDGVISAMRKNMDALTEANRSALEGLQAIARRQSEIMAEAVQQATDGMKTVMTAKSPEENAARQADLVKQTVEQMVANAREIMEIASKSSEAAMDPLRQRLLASFDEVKTIIGPAAAPQKPAKMKAAAE